MEEPEDTAEPWPWKMGSAAGGLHETCNTQRGRTAARKGAEAEKESEVVCVDYKKQPEERAEEGWGPGSITCNKPCSLSGQLIESLKAV